MTLSEALMDPTGDDFEYDFPEQGSFQSFGSTLFRVDTQRRSELREEQRDRKCRRVGIGQSCTRGSSRSLR